jgi:putative transposase
MPSQRHLPHIYPADRWLFLTWHLHGSLPSSHFPPARKVSDGEAFAWVDRYLDGAHAGPVYLRREAIATVVIEALFRGQELEHYRLGAFVIMANHVHLLLLPSISPSLLLKSLKGVTAREANRLLCRTGEQFWQRESYDHWVRDESEWNRIAAYIERNPVKAGLVARVEDYPWSSANPKWRPSVHAYACGHDACVHTNVNAARTSACATSDTRILA